MAVRNIAVGFRGWKPRIWNYETVSVAYGLDVVGWRLDLFGLKIDRTVRQAAKMSPMDDELRVALPHIIGARRVPV